MGRRKRVADIPPVDAEEWQPKGPSRFEQLPVALVIDILSRLLVKTLLSCRSVCKSWFSIIFDPHFPLLNSPIDILNKTGSGLLRKPMVIDFTQIKEHAGFQFQLEKIRFTTKISLPPVYGLNLINSCNGLIVLGSAGSLRERDGPLYVSNPILGEYITLPPTDENRIYFSYFGLGYSAATKEYKVLQTCGDRYSDTFVRMRLTYTQLVPKLGKASGKLLRALRG